MDLVFEQATQAEILAALKKATGLRTQQQIADALGCSQVAVCNWLNNKRTMSAPMRKFACHLIAEVM